jgi:hypothetical protein
MDELNAERLFPVLGFFQLRAFTRQTKTGKQTVQGPGYGGSEKRRR